MKAHYGAHLCEFDEYIYFHTRSFFVLVAHLCEFDQYMGDEWSP